MLYRRGMPIPSDRLNLDAIDLEKHPECASMPVVFEIANRLAARWDWNIPGADVDDLVQVGYLALRKAHRSYPGVGDYTRHISARIRSAMVRYVYKFAIPLVLPQHATDRAVSIERGRDPDSPESARIHRLRYSRCHPVEQLTGENLEEPERRPRIARLMDEAMQALAVGLDERWIDREEIEHYLSVLTPKEQLAVRLYYGIGTDEPLTFEEVGKRWGSTRQNVQAAHRKAIGKIRAAF